MRCKTCDYPLWNLAARTCPECGDPFAPSQYQFRPNAVEYRCPHCAQPYFGTGPEGDLVPRAFDCVQCSAHIHMDEMVLVPASGVEPDHAVTDHQPWINRARLGRRRAWWQTSVMGMVKPYKLARCTPEDAALWPAWKFTIINAAIVMGAGYLAVVALGMLGALMMAGGGGGGGGGPGTMTFMALIAGVYAAMFAIAFLATLAFTALWIVLAHAFIRVTGGDAKPMRATSLSILYTSGAYLPSLVPCVNNISWLWWPITAGLTLKQMHGVSGWRAIPAAILPPVLIIAAIIGAYIGFIVWSVSATGGFNATMNTARATANASMQASATAGAIFAHTSTTGSFPDHALELIAAGALQPDDVINPDTLTTLFDVPVGDGDLFEFSMLTPEEQAAAAKAAADALPENVVAHRLGDIVFTHHGFTRRTDFNLWIAIVSPDPDANPGETSVASFLWVTLSSGATETILESDFDASLQSQNALRATHDLPPLPHPSQVTHDAPATSP